MTLLLTFALLAVALAVVFWGGGLFLQTYLYERPADRLPVRAVAAGAVVAGFLTLWTAVNTRGPVKDRYGTLFEFNPTTAKEITSFEAVRRYPGRKDADGNPVEKTAVYRKQGTTFAEAGAPPTRTGFLTNTSEYVTVAVLVRDTGDGPPARFEADLDANGNYKAQPADRRFAAGGRFLEAGNPGVVYEKSNAAVFGAVALNLLHLAAWLAALWPVLRFSFGHAFGLAGILWLAATLLLMPLVFNQNQPKPAAPPPVPAPAEVPAGGP